MNGALIRNKMSADEEDRYTQDAAQSNGNLDEKGARDQYEESEQGVDSDTAQLLIQHREEEEDSDILDSDSDKEGIVYARDHPAYKITRRVLAFLAFVLLFGLLAAAIALIAVSPRCSGAVLPWWKTTVIYQCYPRSFQDSDGDGNGDLVGIQQHVAYLADVGIKAVWLNPIFKSPQRDNGYDVSNYTDVDPMFGTLGDLEDLLAMLHESDSKLILDLVPNHSSDEHPWFLESKSSKDSDKRDWYVWADGVDGGPPNNWVSVFGGSMWTLDNTTGQYYLHQFSEFQPDLNFHNVKVRDAMLEVLKFWFDFGVDGFRVDAVKHLLEDPMLRSEARDPSFNSTTNNCTTNITSSYCYNSLIHNLTTDYAGIHEIIQDWRKLSDSYSGDRFLVGEIYDPIDEVMTYYGNDSNEFHFPFNFLLLGNSEWTGTNVSDLIELWLDNMPQGAWPNWVLGNHDNARIASKAGLYLARALNVLLLTLPGTPTTYYGEEILMTNVDVPDSEKHDDFAGRDAERTPMQWNISANAGFTTNSNPWLPVASNFSTYNVEVENNQTSSMLSLYKQLVNLRSKYAAFQYSDYEGLLNTTEVLGFRRFHQSEGIQFIVLVNFSLDEVKVSLNSTTDFVDAEAILSTHSDLTEEVDLSAIDLATGQALVIKGRGKDACSG